MSSAEWYDVNISVVNELELSVTSVIVSTITNRGVSVIVSVWVFVSGIPVSSPPISLSQVVDTSTTVATSRVPSRAWAIYWFDYLFFGCLQNLVVSFDMSESVLNHFLAGHGLLHQVSKVVYHSVFDNVSLWCKLTNALYVVYPIVNLFC